MSTTTKATTPIADATKYIPIWSESAAQLVNACRLTAPTKATASTPMRAPSDRSRCDTTHPMAAPTRPENTTWLNTPNWGLDRISGLPTEVLTVKGQPMQVLTDPGWTT
jgi:hypothetical protein